MSHQKPDTISTPPASQSFIDAATVIAPRAADILAPGLYIVSTPIGNLRDITLRALDVLTGVDHVLAEDTRQSRKLFNAYNIETPLSAYHDHNVAKRIPEIISRLEAGETLALISDAGTPLVSDPGFKLVRAVVAAGYQVFPVPGASAVLAGLVGAGLPSDKFTFAGFLPAKSAARQTQLERFKTAPGTLIFFETGPRIQDSLLDMQEVLGAREAVLARELTKRYEEFRRGTLLELIEGVIQDVPRGEIVVLIAPSEAPTEWVGDQIETALKTHIPEMGVKRASAHVASLSGWAKRDVYQLALTLK